MKKTRRSEPYTFGKAFQRKYECHEDPAYPVKRKGIALYLRAEIEAGGEDNKRKKKNNQKPVKLT
jgi:hypothetical protein